MSLRLHSLSVSIDEAVHQCLLSSAPSTGPPTSCWGLAERGSICCSGSPSSWPGEFRCCLRCWLGVPLLCTSYTSALNATAQQTGCVGNGDRIACHNTIRDVLYTLLPSLLPWRHLRRCPTSSPVPSPDQLTSTSPTWSRGCPAALHLPSPSSSRPWVRLPSHLATYALQCRSVSSAN